MNTIKLTNRQMRMLRLASLDAGSAASKNPISNIRINQVSVVDEWLELYEKLAPRGTGPK